VVSSIGRWRADENLHPFTDSSEVVCAVSVIDNVSPKGIKTSKKSSLVGSSSSSQSALFHSNQPTPNPNLQPQIFNMSNIGNVAGGHKANLNNPNTSEESKQHSRDVLENELDGGNVGGNDDSNRNPGNMYVFQKVFPLRQPDISHSAGGLKATMKNPNVSQEAKDSAEQRLGGLK
jgi:hypothetical protein